MMETFAYRIGSKRLKKKGSGSICFAPGPVQLLVPVVFLRWLNLLLAGAFIFHNFSQANAQQSGFVSLACGASKSFTSSGIYWMPDDEYAPPGVSIANVSNKLGSLRSFPNTTNLSTRICYSLPIPQTPPPPQGIMILVRATFDYLDYDGLNQPPIFEVYLGPALLSKVDLTMKSGGNNDTWVVEVIFNSTETQALCLLREKGNPVISSLEVRPVINASYVGARTSATTMLRTVYRINCGASTPLRYPDDPSDRIWSSDESYFSPLTAKAINSTSNLLSVSQVHDQAPAAVLGSARVNYQNQSLTYALPLPSDLQTLMNFQFNVYFSELFNSSSLNLSVDNHLLLPQITLHPFVAVEYTNPEYSQGAWWNLTLQPISGAPLINALEVFSPISVNPTLTVSSDVSELQAIQSNWNFSLDWVNNSDPCLPVSWEGITCTGSQVTSLDLSNMSLKGTTLDVNWLFQNLQNLDLSNNFLAGSLTKFSELSSLETLNLSNNYLSGPLVYLEGLSNLMYLNIMNNNFSGSIPPQFLDPKFTFLYTGNPCLNSSNEACQSSASPPSLPPSNIPSESKSSTSIGPIVGGAVGGVLVVVAILLLLFFIFRRRRQQHRPMLVPQNSKLAVPIKDQVIELGNHTSVRLFSLKELDLATNHFRDLIGEGSFGPVFLGRLADRSEVAIKRRADTSKMGTDSFLNEVNLLSQVHHPNLVELLGYHTSYEKQKPVQMLVYEYMPGGTLMDHLYGKLAKTRPLEWRDRLSLVVGAAAGIEYLHDGSDPKIIHRDVKSSNILISSRNVAKVSDFGLSKLVVDLDKSHFTTGVKGTAGYLDPEYFHSQQLTEKSDVYSFGVVLLEILCAREPLSGNYEPDAYNLTAWARPFLQQNVPKGDYSILDPSLLNQFNPKSLEIVSNLALRCTENYGIRRPIMSEVLRELKRALAVEDGVSSEMAYKQSPRVSEEMPFSAIIPR
ncbi:unnamed protein product [Sphagnum tenellum]